jgi:ribosomal protein S18 acetylase RimI-like enzyme
MDNPTLGMNLSLRPASAHDAELVYGIKHEAYADYAIEAYGSWEEGLQRGYILRNLRFTRLILVDGTIVGWIAADTEAPAVDIADVHILPVHQRKGYGTEAVGIVLREAFAAGKAVTLGVLKNNPARSLYDRIGFTVTGATKTHFLMKLPRQSSEPAPSSGTPPAEQGARPR